MLEPGLVRTWHCCRPRPLKSPQHLDAVMADFAALPATTDANQASAEPWKCRGCGKRGKPTTGFPLFPRAPWKSRHKPARFPHSHRSGDEGGWKSGKPKAGFPLSHRPDFYPSEPKHSSGGLSPPPAAALRAASPTTSTNSVTFSREATRPGVLIVADHGSAKANSIPSKSFHGPRFRRRLLGEHPLQHHHRHSQCRPPGREL